MTGQPGLDASVAAQLGRLWRVISIAVAVITALLAVSFTLSAVYTAVEYDELRVMLPICTWIGVVCFVQVVRATPWASSAVGRSARGRAALWTVVGLLFFPVLPACLAGLGVYF